MNIESIQNRMNDDLVLFRQEFESIINNERKIIKEFVSYVLKSQGKQIRPVLLLLAARLCGQTTKKTHVAASLIELTHCASLIHDDIVDEAFQRRGMLSVYALWRNKKSVLIGDYIFSRAIHAAVEYELYDILRKISQVIERMSIGEMEQSDASLRLDITEEEYYSIIRDKTAVLLSSCAYSGALTAGGTAEDCARMERFGEILGMIFQIKDDVLDYSKSDALGKLACNDIKERKITLPLIVALRECDETKRREIIRAMKKVKKDASAVKEVHSFVMSSGGFAYCRSVIAEYERQAYEILDEYPDSEEKTALKDFVKYLIEREK